MLSIHLTTQVFMKIRLLSNQKDSLMNMELLYHQATLLDISKFIYYSLNIQQIVFQSI